MRHTRRFVHDGSQGSPGRGVRSGLASLMAVLISLTLLAPASASPAVEAAPSASVAPGSQSITSCGGGTSSGVQGIEPADIAKWFGTKATDFIKSSKPLELGFSAIFKLSGLDKIIFGDPNAKVLKELKAIQGQLAAVQAQLDNLQDLVNQAIKEDRQNNFGRILQDMCDIANVHSSFFTDEYMAWIDAGVALGDALEKNADGSAQAAVQAAKAEVAKRQDEMVSQWTQKMTANSADISQRLLPGLGSATTAYGKVLMNDRFLNLDSSRQLRGLYDEFNQLEALTSWMNVEVYQARGNTVGWQAAVKRYTDQAKSQTATLPPMIPEGTVIDLGRENASTAFNQPMWVPPTTEDKGWFDGFELGTSRAIPANNAVPQTIADLNIVKPLGLGWAVPTATQMIALLSSGCIADPLKPTQYSNKLPCKNAVPAGKTVAGYLLARNPDNTTWQSLFCQNTAQKSCAQGGAGINGSPPHQFIWIKEQSSIWTKCGYTIIPPDIYRQTYTVHAGQVTSAGTAAIGRRPYLPDKSPSYGLQEKPYGLSACNKYVNTLVNGTATDTQGFAAQGVVLATRQTSTTGFDTNTSPMGEIDYMSQKVVGGGGAVPIEVKARAKGKKLRVGRSTEVVTEVKASGKVRIYAHCVRNGTQIKGACAITVKQSRGRVLVTPRCNDNIKVHVKIVSRSTEDVWQRTWRVQKSPAVSCSARGTG